MTQTSSLARARRMSRVAGLGGLALFTGLIAYQGARDVAAILASAGVGLAIITIFHLSTLAAHTVAWQRLLPTPPPTLRLLFWARWIAESINDLLPVAQIGGNFVRAVLVQRAGVAGTVAGASVIVDVTTNFFAQLLFTMLGLGLLLVHVRGGAPVASVGAGIAIMGASAVAFLIAQRRGMFAFLARRIEQLSWTPQWATLSAGAATLDTVIDGMYRDRRAIVVATIWHFLSWLAGGVEIWLALQFLGHPLPLLAVVMMEALTEAVRSAAFAVPGALGVQEGGYLIVGAWLGLAPDVALAVSLAKRVREVVIGIPGLMAWQLQGAASLWGERGGKEGT
jgi:putative membrane protein